MAVLSLSLAVPIAIINPRCGGKQEEAGAQVNNTVGFTGVTGRCLVFVMAAEEPAEALGRLIEIIGGLPEAFGEWGRLWVNYGLSGQGILWSMRRKSHRSNFPAVFPIDFVGEKLAKVVSNGSHVTLLIVML